MKFETLVQVSKKVSTFINFYCLNVIAFKVRLSIKLKLLPSTTRDQKKTTTKTHTHTIESNKIFRLSKKYDRLKIN